LLTPDYVLVGHLCRDLLGEKQRPGGTVLYAGVTAMRLGRRVGIVTSHGSDLAVPEVLAGASIATVPAAATTTFTHAQGPEGRVLTLTARAETIAVADVPEAWRAAEIVHFAPIAWEVDGSLPGECSAPWRVATPQGWLRRTGQDGVIVADVEQVPELPLHALRALVTSAEDLGGQDQLAAWIAARCPVTAVTRGAAGCTLYTHGTATQIAAWPADEADSTGAGDVFATALFVRLSETGDPVQSARFAACVAGLSVEGEGVSGIPTRAQVEARLQERL
jgi:sugar/nucleoside kinase (ribokinase family)